MNVVTMNRPQVPVLVRLLGLDIISALVAVVLLDQIALQTRSAMALVGLGGAVVALRFTSRRVARGLTTFDTVHLPGARILLRCAQIVMVLALVNTISDRYADSAVVLFLVDMGLGMLITLEGWVSIRPLVRRERSLHRPTSASDWLNHMDQGQRLLLALVAVVALVAHGAPGDQAGLEVGVFFGIAAALAPTALVKIGKAVEDAFTGQGLALHPKH